MQADGLAKALLRLRHLGQNRRQRAHHPVGVFNLAAAVGQAIGLRLPEKAGAGLQAMATGTVLPRLDPVIAHGSLPGRAENAGMDEREMRHVEEVLDNPRPAGGDLVRAANDLVEARIAMLGKRQHVRRRRADAHPDQPIAFDYGKHARAGRGWRNVARQGRNVTAATIRCEAPAVIRALQFTAVDFANREACAAMRTAILPGVNHAVVATPQGHVTSKQAGRRHRPGRERRRQRQRMPVIAKHQLADRHWSARVQRRIPNRKADSAPALVHCGASNWSIAACQPVLAGASSQEASIEFFANCRKSATESARACVTAM